MGSVEDCTVCLGVAERALPRVGRLTTMRVAADRSVRACATAVDVRQRRVRREAAPGAGKTGAGFVDREPWPFACRASTPGVLYEIDGSVTDRVHSRWIHMGTQVGLDEHAAHERLSKQPLHGLDEGSFVGNAFCHPPPIVRTAPHDEAVLRKANALGPREGFIHGADGFMRHDDVWADVLPHNLNIMAPVNQHHELQVDG